MYGPVPVLLSVAVTVKLTVPAAVGVPDKTPVDVENDNPAGMLPVLMVRA